MNYLVIVLIIFFIMVLFVLSLLIIHLYSIRPRREDKKDRAIIREIDKSLLNLHFEGLSAEDEALLRAKVEKPQWEQPKSDPETAGLDGPSKDATQEYVDDFLLNYNEMGLRYSDVDRDHIKTITNDFIKDVSFELNKILPPREAPSKDFLADFGINKDDPFPHSHPRNRKCPYEKNIQRTDVFISYDKIRY